MKQVIPTVIELRNVSKRFVLRKDKSVKDRLLHPFQSKQFEEDFWALRDIDLEVKAGSTIGLIGPNGSGKSTLLKVIGGIIDSDTGSVETRGRVAALIELGAGFHPDLTGRENVYLNASILGMSRQETEEKFDEIVSFSGIEQFIDTQVKFYSSGMYVRLAFAVAIHSDPDLLLVDEVLAVGDEAFQQKCLSKISEFQKQGRTIIIVSHSMGQIASLCDRVVVLGHGHMLFDGEPEEGITVLRAGFNGSEGVIDVSGQSDDKPRAARIHSVISSVPDGSALHPGEALTVNIEFEVEDPTDRWDLTVGLVNPLESTVMATSAHASGIGNLPIQGRQVVTMEFPNLSLGEGGYTLSVGYFDGQQREVCRTDGVGLFRVEAGHQSIGTIFSEVSAQLSPASDS
ncbi:MAG: ABC transporter ATP-binding protein [Scrofimicrobium sp.]